MNAVYNPRPVLDQVGNALNFVIMVSLTVAGAVAYASWPQPARELPRLPTVVVTAQAPASLPQLPTVVVQAKRRAAATS